MREFFTAIEQSALSIWMREDPYAYFLALIFHAFGMALLVGGGIVVSLRVLGVAAGAPYCLPPTLVLVPVVLNPVAPGGPFNPSRVRCGPA